MKSLFFLFVIFCLILLDTVIAPLFYAMRGVSFFLVFVLSVSLFRPIRESLLLSFLVGLIVNALSFSSSLLNIIFFPLLAFLVYAFFQFFWGRPDIRPFFLLVFVVTFFYGVLIFYLRFRVRDNLFLVGMPDFLGVWEDFKHYERFYFSSLLINSLIIAPVFYFIFKRLNPVFDYWDQKKKI